MATARKFWDAVGHPNDLYVAIMEAWNSQRLSGKTGGLEWKSLFFRKE